MSANIYYPGEVGTWIITATYTTLSATATVTVSMGKIKSIKIVDEGDQKISIRTLAINSAFTFYIRGYDDKLNKAYIPATWTLSSNNIGTISHAFGTSTIFFATSIGYGTITATNGTNTATLTIIVGNQIDAIKSYIGTLTTSWGTATIRIGTNTESLIILPPEPASGSFLQNLSGNIGVGIVVNAYGTSGNHFSGTLTNPVYIEIHYNEAQLGNIDENTLRLYISSDNGNTWGTITCSLDTAQNIILGTFSHFSIIAPAGASKQVAAKNLTNIIAYPNPCKGHNKITFSNLTDQCKIRI